MSRSGGPRIGCGAAGEQRRPPTPRAPPGPPPARRRPARPPARGPGRGRGVSRVCPAARGPRFESRFGRGARPSRTARIHRPRERVRAPSRAEPGRLGGRARTRVRVHGPAPRGAAAVVPALRVRPWQASQAAGAGRAGRAPTRARTAPSGCWRAAVRALCARAVTLCRAR
jgi:hypothetical protein